MFLRGIGAPELILVLVIVLIVFGVGRLGEIGGALGKGIREFRKATGGVDEESVTTKVVAEAYDLKVKVDDENYDIKVKVDDDAFDKKVKVVADDKYDKRVKIVDDASYGWKVKVVNPEALRK